MPLTSGMRAWLSYSNCLRGLLAPLERENGLTSAEQAGEAPRTARGAC
ncbi:hypothetical protein [Streptomyces sp. NPDC002520]